MLNVKILNEDSPSKINQRIILKDQIYEQNQKLHNLMNSTKKIVFKRKM